MRLSDKIKNLNKYVSFNLMGLNGLVFFVILSKIFYYEYYIDYIVNQKLSGQGIVTWEVIIIILYAGAIASFLFGGCLYETTTNYRIENKLLTQNPIVLILKYIGVLLSIMYVFLAFIMPIIIIWG